MNEILILAHGLRHATFHHDLAVVPLYMSVMVLGTHYDNPVTNSIEREICYKICRRRAARLRRYIDDACDDSIRYITDK